MNLLRQQKDAIQNNIECLFDQWAVEQRERRREYNILNEVFEGSEADLKDRNATIEELKNANLGLEIQVSRLQYRVQQVEPSAWTALGEEANALRERHDSLRKEHGSLREQHDSLYERHDSLCEQHGSLRKEHERYKAMSQANEQELIKRLKKDREKLKRWSQFASPGGRPVHSPALTEVDPSRVPDVAVHVNNMANRVPGEKGHDASTPTRHHSAEAHVLARRGNDKPDSYRPGQSLQVSYTDAAAGTSPSSAVTLRMPETVNPAAVGATPPKDDPPELGKSECVEIYSQGSALRAANNRAADKPLDSEDRLCRAPDLVNRKDAGQDPAGSHAFIGHQSDPITIKSDPDTELVMSRVPHVTAVNNRSDLTRGKSQDGIPERQDAVPAPLSVCSKSSKEKVSANIKTVTASASTPPPVGSKPGVLTRSQQAGRKDINGTTGRSQPLSVVDSNTRRSPRIVQKGYGSKSKKRKSDDSRGVAAIPTITEDGEDYSTKSRKVRERGSANPRLADPSVQQRLDNLLTTPRSGGKSPLIPMSKTEAEDCNPAKTEQEMVPSGDTSTAVAEKATFNPSTTPSTGAAAAPLRRKPPAYRSLPLSSLQLHHFKLNPAANHNLDYAYTDVVRKKADRKCIPGCTRPECCGPIFAAMARTLYPASSTGPDQAKLSLSQLSAADKKMLYEYLGAHYHTLSTSPSKEGDIGRLLSEARTAHLATQYGKSHRSSLHPRPRTPPGFWNVDFPSTQQAAEDRRLAEEREREEVERRWVQARKNAENRGGSGCGSGVERGLWMFADE